MLIQKMLWEGRCLIASESGFGCSASGFFAGCLSKTASQLSSCLLYHHTYGSLIIHETKFLALQVASLRTRLRTRRYSALRPLVLPLLS